MTRIGMVGAGAVAALLTAVASGQTITSPDGTWSASLDANGTGQITNFNAFGADNLFETLWYEASIFSGGVSARVESNYGPVSQNVGAHGATFSLLRNDGRMQLDVSVTMIDGANGGASYRLTWTSLSGDERLKPFAYADFDVGGDFADDTAAFDMVEQAIVQSDAGGSPTVYFGGTQTYKSWQITTFSTLRTTLDNGVAQLASSGGGSNADFTAALAGELVPLGAGDSASFTFQIGGLAVPAPPAFAALGLAALRRRRPRR